MARASCLHFSHTVTTPTDVHPPPPRHVVLGGEMLDGGPLGDLQRPLLYAQSEMYGRLSKSSRISSQIMYVRFNEALLMHTDP
jgi:hypothetical protein